MIKGALKSKTIWVQAVTAAFGVAIVTMPVLKEVMTPDRYAYSFMALSILNAVLRAATTKPLSEKG